MEFVVSSHDPDMRSMSYDTGIAETLIVARRLNEGEGPSRRGKFVNLWRAARSETDALALVSAVNSVASRPSLSSDGPPVGGSPLMVGGEQWGEVIEGPVGESAWKAARWKYALIGQFAAAVERGELWTEDGVALAGQVPIAAMAEVCNVGPQHRRIRGSLGVFDGYHGFNEQSQFPALWSLNSEIHQGMISEPNAWLIPKPNKDHAPIWEQSGTLQVTCDVRYNAQRIMATRTSTRALGVSSWHTIIVSDDDVVVRAQREVALAIWCNSTIGLLFHANHANRTQEGRGEAIRGCWKGCRRWMCVNSRRGSWRRRRTSGGTLSCGSSSRFTGVQLILCVSSLTSG